MDYFVWVSFLILPRTVGLSRHIFHSLPAMCVAPTVRMFFASFIILLFLLLLWGQVFARGSVGWI